MPTYQYQCRNCGHRFEELQSIKEAPLTLCPKCHNESLARVLGTGAGVIFKGSGFYQTDYKKSGSPENASPKLAKEGSPSDAPAAKPAETPKPSGGEEKKG